jgi:RNA polymerase sigma-B factor
VRERGDPLIQLDLTVDEPGALHAARRAIADAVPELRTADRTDLLVLVSELVAALAGPERHPVDIALWRSDRGVRVEVVGPDGARLDKLARTLLDELAEEWHIGDGIAGFELATHAPALDSVPEEELFVRAAEGVREARDLLADRYRGFARALSRRFTRRGTTRDDAEQVAYLALVKALERFEPERGLKFTTYAARTIEGELKRNLRDTGWSVRVPRGLQELGMEAIRTANELAQAQGRDPSLDEVAAHIDGEPDEIASALLARRSYNAASLDAPTASDDDARVLLDTVPHHDQRLVRAPEWADLSLVVDHLPERERRILYLRFFEDLSQSEIADRIGISQMHVSRLLARSLADLRRLLLDEV